MSDPDEILGLARLCERMIFAGSLKYHNLDAFDQFLNEHDGRKSCSTNSDHTIFHIQIDESYLGPALDRLAQYFISPLFQESQIKKEIEKLNDEYRANLKNDQWRLNELDKFLATDKHAYARFSAGNFETLREIPKEKNIDMRKELLKFYSNWYSSNVMSLTVVGTGM